MVANRCSSCQDSLDKVNRTNLSVDQGRPLLRDLPGDTHVDILIRSLPAPFVAF